MRAFSLLNILFIGSSSELSLLPLNTLLESRHKVCAVGIVSDTSFQNIKYPIIASKKEGIEQRARMSGLPVISLFDTNGDYVNAIKRCAPDVILVSCFARKLPDEILAIPEIGCFNLHPSLLPAYRGPVPLFWQFRDGINTFGVTLHRLTSLIDAGPILGQQLVKLEDGVSGLEASTRLARAGAQLVLDCLADFELGNERESIQDEKLAITRSWPGDEDFTIDTNWSAQRIHNFICGTQEWGHTYRCVIAEKSLELLSSISYNALKITDKQLIINNNIVTIQCNPGSLKAITNHTANT